jgi:hypothetical protein
MQVGNGEGDRHLPQIVNVQASPITLEQLRAQMNRFVNPFARQCCCGLMDIQGQP